MDRLVQYELGLKDSDRYKFELRKLRGGTLNFFVKKEVSRSEKKKKAGRKQLALF